MKGLADWRRIAWGLLWMGSAVFARETVVPTLPESAETDRIISTGDIIAEREIPSACAFVLDHAWDRHYPRSDRLRFFDRALHYLERIAETPLSRPTLMLFIRVITGRESLVFEAGLYGQARQDLDQAEECLAKWLGSDTLTPDVFRRLSEYEFANIHNLFTGRAKHQELTGHLPEAESTLRQIIDLTSASTQSAEYIRRYNSRALNNLSILLGYMGRDEEGKEILARARGSAEEAVDDGVREVNFLAHQIDTEGISRERYDQMMARAEKFRKAGKPEAALHTERRAAGFLYKAGSTNEAFALYQSVLERAAAGGFPRTSADALYWRGKARATAADPGAEQDFLDALDYYRQSGFKFLEGQLYQSYARLLRKMGRIEEGLCLNAEGIRIFRECGAPHRIPEALADRITLLLRAGRFEEAEAVWAQVNRLMNEMPRMSPSRRLDILHQWQFYLAVRGRLADLEEFRKTVIAWIATTDLIENETRTFLEFRATPDLPIPEAPARTAPDLQPYYVATRSDPGAPAEAWFWLANTSAVDWSGPVSISAPGDISILTLDTTLCEVRISGMTNVALKTILPTVRVTPDAMFLLRVVSQGGDGSAAQVRLSAAGGTESRWDIAPNTDPTSPRTLLHASLLACNPFFHIPVFHPIMWPVAPDTPLNLRVRANAPCRVEIYDIRDSRLLATDTQGDGSYMEAGDVLTADSDRNGFPEVSGKNPAVIIRVFPVPNPSYSDPLDLVLEIRIAGEWHTIGHDRLLNFGKQK
jgi:tetratricopeptide (TPR) repeat protein